jgi:hypothetical protein
MTEKHKYTKSYGDGIDAKTGMRESDYCYTIFENEVFDAVSLSEFEDYKNKVKKTIENKINYYETEAKRIGLNDPVLTKQLCAIIIVLEKLKKELEL